MDVEPAPLLREAREKDDLEQKISELALERLRAALVDGRQRFVGLLEQVCLQGFEGLLAIPGAILPQTVDQADQAIEALGHARIIPGGLPG